MKYYTGLSNITPLSLQEAWSAIKALAMEFELDMNTTEVIKLEWGLNITLPEDMPVNCLIRNILVYKGKTPSQHVFEKNGKMYVFDLNEFSIKIYNKSAQFKEFSHTNIMRYELPIHRKAMLNKLVFILNDLFKKKNIKALQSKLLNTIDHLIFYDYSIRPTGLPRKTLELFFEFKNATAWEKLQKANPELYRKKKIAFAKQVIKYSDLNWNKFLKEEIKQASAKLLHENYALTA